MSYTENQTTLKGTCLIEGIGVHTGAVIQLTLTPASPDTGLVFKRTDLPEAAPILGRWDLVSDTRMCTQLTNQGGVSIGTVEHLLAALRAYEIDNVLIEINGPEIPILDGSSQGFMDAISKVGVGFQPSRRRILVIKKTIEIKEDNRFARLDPIEKADSSQGMTFDFSIDFFGGREGMKPQSYQFAWTPESFRQEIGRARTFGFYEDAQKLQAVGLAQGASLENAVVIKEGQVMNEDGLRFPDEFVRHKILDAVGDLALAGAPIIGAYSSHNGGHELNNRLLRKMFEADDTWEKSA